MRVHAGAGFALPAIVLSVGFSYGCMRPSEHAAPVLAARVSLRMASPAAAAGAVQALPEYERARKACAAGKYRQAAEILAGMARSQRLTPDEQAFCRAQEQICLGRLAPRSARSARVPPTEFRAGLQGVDCGPRALLFACERLGVRTSLSELSRAAGTGRRGTSLQGLKRAAETLHLHSEGIQTGREGLAGMQVPAIAWINTDHYVAVLELKGSGESGLATIHDPNEAESRTVPQERLLQACSGYFLTLRR